MTAIHTTQSDSELQFSSALLKVASRCNLSCDYCYMYEHADQSWRQQPRFMSGETRQLAVDRITEYLKQTGRSAFSVVLHGGEPLLAGAEALCEISDAIRAASPNVRIDVGIQTNGVLLSPQAVASFREHDIAVSLSLDGPVEVHDQHRPTNSGKGSHAEVMRGLALLQRNPSIFSGVIAVIDPSTDPRETVAWFARLGIPALDLLLPDAHHGSDIPPEEHQRLREWLVGAFDEWFDNFPHLRLRTFDALLGAVAGVPSNTDAFGFGDVSMLCIETDGSYHDLDVLKITEEGRTRLGATLAEVPIVELQHSPVLTHHRHLLTPEGLSDICRSCSEVEICGGGSLPHRFDPDGSTLEESWANPSVYCEELKSLIRHIRKRLDQQLNQEVAHREPLQSTDGPINWPQLDAPGGARDLYDDWALLSAGRLRDYCSQQVDTQHPDDEAKFQEIASRPLGELAELAASPQAQVLLHVRSTNAQGGVVRFASGEPVDIPMADLMEPVPSGSRPAVHRDDPVLRLPFAEPIVFINPDDPQMAAHKAGFAEALGVVESYSAALSAELALLCPDVQFVRDISAHPDKSVSFSDDVVPGVLFIAPPMQWDAEAVYDVADSLVHEYRHQKLYLIDRAIPLVAADWPLISSPWREEPRPPSGLLHALFVFVELLDYWDWVAGSAAEPRVVERARRDREVIAGRLSEGFSTLATTRLTPEGRRLSQWLESRFESAR